jgi:hypothetical protein
MLTKSLIVLFFFAFSQWKGHRSWLLRVSAHWAARARFLANRQDMVDFHLCTLLPNSTTSRRTLQLPLNPFIFLLTIV